MQNNGNNSKAIMTAEQVAIEEVKRCTRCRVAKARTLEFFPPHKHTADRLDSWCRECRKAYRSDLHRSSHERDLKYARQYRADNRELCIARTRLWRGNNPGYHVAKSAEWRAENTEARLVYQANTSARRAIYSAQWSANNRQKVNAKTHRYRSRKQGNGGTHDAADVQAQIDAQTDKRDRLHCWWCGQVIAAYHVDHVVPLARGGDNSPANIVISCPSCNRRKSAKTASEFMGRLL